SQPPYFARPPARFSFGLRQDAWRAPWPRVAAGAWQRSVAAGTRSEEIFGKPPPAAGHSSNWEPGGAGLRGGEARGGAPPRWRARRPGGSGGDPRPGATPPAARSPPRAAPRSVIRSAKPPRPRTRG